MITENNKRIEFENLQDAMRIAKALLKNGYQVYMNIEDEIGDGKIVVIIEYEFVDEDLANGHYIYKSFTDEANEEVEEVSQKKDDKESEDYLAGHAEGFEAGWTCGYERRREEEADTEETTENCEDSDDDDDYHDDYSSWSEEHRKWFDAGYDEGYATAKYDFCDYADED